MEWGKFRKEIVNLQSTLSLFKVEFLDRDGFKRFADNLSANLDGYTEICITGYFSETIRESLESIIRLGYNIRLICPELSGSKRDKKNLQALKKLVHAGVKIRNNIRLHARFLVAYNPKVSKSRGLLIIGSFDFNTECIGRERYDAGIKTKHPDLISPAIELFEQIWNEPESLPLLERYRNEINK